VTPSSKLFTDFNLCVCKQPRDGVEPHYPAASDLKQISSVSYNVWRDGARPVADVPAIYLLPL
jgi:hypothetical protein